MTVLPISTVIADEQYHRRRHNCGSHPHRVYIPGVSHDGAYHGSAGKRQYQMVINPKATSETRLVLDKAGVAELDPAHEIAGGRDCEVRQFADIAEQAQLHRRHKGDRNSHGRTHAGTNPMTASTVACTAIAQRRGWRSTRTRSDLRYEDNAMPALNERIGQTKVSACTQCLVARLTDK